MTLITRWKIAKKFVNLKKIINVFVTLGKIVMVFVTTGKVEKSFFTLKKVAMIVLTSKKVVKMFVRRDRVAEKRLIAASINKTWLQKELQLEAERKGMLLSVVLEKVIFFLPEV